MDFLKRFQEPFPWHYAIWLQLTCHGNSLGLLSCPPTILWFRPPALLYLLWPQPKEWNHGIKMNKHGNPITTWKYFCLTSILWGAASTLQHMNLNLLELTRFPAIGKHCQSSKHSEAKHVQALFWRFLLWPQFSFAIYTNLVNPSFYFLIIVSYYFFIISLIL